MPTHEQLPRNSETPSGGGDTGGVSGEGLEVLLEVKATDLSWTVAMGQSWAQGTE